jgi:hypothetical protein
LAAGPPSQPQSSLVVSVIARTTRAVPSSHAIAATLREMRDVVAEVAPLGGSYGADRSALALSKTNSTVTGRRDSLMPAAYARRDSLAHSSPLRHMGRGFSTLANWHSGRLSPLVGALRRATSRGTDGASLSGGDSLGVGSASRSDLRRRDGAAAAATGAGQKQLLAVAVEWEGQRFEQLVSGELRELSATQFLQEPAQLLRLLREKLAADRAAARLLHQRAERHRPVI